jgi:hypothetical protein
LSYLQVFLYIMPARWYMASIVKTEFLGTEFNGAKLVENPQPGELSYVCDDPTVYTCFGRTGEQVCKHLIIIWTIKSLNNTTSIDRNMQCFY